MKLRHLAVLHRHGDRSPIISKNTFTFECDFVEEQLGLHLSALQKRERRRFRVLFMDPPKGQKIPYLGKLRSSFSV